MNLWSTEKRFHPKIVCFETTKTTFQNFEFVYFLRLSLTVIDFPSVWCAQHLSLCFANQFDANRCSFENSVDSVKHVQTFQQTDSWILTTYKLPRNIERATQAMAYTTLC